MRKTCLTRHIDEFGKVSIPRSIREQFKLADGDKLEVWVDDEGIYLKLPPEARVFNNFVEYFKSIYTSTDVPVALFNNNVFVAGHERLADPCVSVKCIPLIQADKNFFELRHLDYSEMGTEPAKEQKLRLASLLKALQFYAKEIFTEG